MLGRGKCSGDARLETPPPRRTPTLKAIRRTFLCGRFTGCMTTPLCPPTPRAPAACLYHQPEPASAMPLECHKNYPTKALRRAARRGLPPGEARHLIGKLGPLRREVEIRVSHAIARCRGKLLSFSGHGATFGDAPVDGKAQEFRCIENWAHGRFPFARCMRLRRHHSHVDRSHIRRGPCAFDDRQNTKILAASNPGNTARSP